MKKYQKLILIAPIVLAAFWSNEWVKAEEIQTVQAASSQTTETISPAATSEVESGTTATTSLALDNTSDLQSATSSETATTQSISDTTNTNTSSSLSTVSATATSESAPAVSISQDSQSFQESSAIATSSSSTVTTFEAQPMVLAAVTPEPVTAVVTDKGINLQYNNTIPADTSVLYAVWGAKDAQNDLIWYSASSTGAAYVDFSRHREYGTYNIHTYTKSNGKMTGVNTMTVDLLMPQVKTSIANSSDSSFTIDITNVPETITSLSVPVWTDLNKQDDLKWYKASKVAQGAFQVTVKSADHNNEKGLYNIHIYGYSTILGKQIGITTTTFNNGVIKPNAVVSVTNYAETKTQFTVNVVGSSDTKTIKAVSMAVWSEGSGQDDLKWYKPIVSGNSASQVIDIANHSNTSDNYIVHVYTDYTDGSRVGTNLGAYKIVKEVIPLVKPTVSVENYLADKGSLEVRVHEGSKAISKISVAAWSTSDQSNIHWYQEIPLAEQDTIIKVNQAYHDFLVGNYTVHTYIDYADKTREGYNLGSYEFPVKVGQSASQGNYDIINKVIYLDAGHGGYDPGAVYFGTSEKTLNLQMQTLVKNKLEAQGYKVVTTRTDDSYTDLLPRSEKANSSLSDLFVSLHFNASTSPLATGIETYYYEYYEEYPSRINEIFHNDSERLSRSAYLAEAIQAAAVANTGAQNNGVLRNTFAVLRETTAPAVLLELGYMSNPEEYLNISTNTYQNQLANGIVSGILSYYKNYKNYTI